VEKKVRNKRPKERKDGMILLLAMLKAKKGQAQEVLEALRAFSDAVKSEPGTLAWRLYQSLTEPEQFFAFEAYKDQEAFEAHARSGAFQSLVTSLADRLEVPLEVTFLNEAVAVGQGING
jgi:quinol monooxygenase YgiN